jgi:hypothetical protein
LPSIFFLLRIPSRKQSRLPRVSRVTDDKDDTMIDDGGKLNHAECVPAAGASSLSGASDSTDADGTASLDMDTPHNDHAYAAVGETVMNTPSGVGADVHCTPPRTPVTSTNPVMVDVVTKTACRHASPQ